MLIRKMRESVQCKEYEIQNDYAEQNDNKKNRERSDAYDPCRAGGRLSDRSSLEARSSTSV